MPPMHIEEAPRFSGQVVTGKTLLWIVRLGQCIKRMKMEFVVMSHAYIPELAKARKPFSAGIRDKEQQSKTQKHTMATVLGGFDIHLI